MITYELDTPWMCGECEMWESGECTLFHFSVESLADACDAFILAEERL